MAVTDLKINPHNIRGTLDAHPETVGPYRYRASSMSSPWVLRVEVRGTFTGTIQLQLCSPESTTGYVIDTYTGEESVVVEPGGDCDLIFKTTAWTSGTALVAIYAGPRD